MSPGSKAYILVLELVTMVGMMRIEILIVLLILGLSACTEAENSHRYPDTHVYERFVQELDQNGIRYRKGENQRVYYVVSDSKKVKEITDEINATYYPGCGGSFTTKEDRAAMADELKRQGIPFSEVELDDGPSITCAPEDREKYNLIIRSSNR